MYWHLKSLKMYLLTPLVLGLMVACQPVVTAQQPVGLPEAIGRFECKDTPDDAELLQDENGFKMWFLGFDGITLDQQHIGHFLLESSALECPFTFEGSTSPENLSRRPRDIINRGILVGGSATIVPEEISKRHEMIYAVCDENDPKVDIVECRGKASDRFQKLGITFVIGDIAQDPSDAARFYRIYIFDGKLYFGTT